MKWFCHFTVKLCKGGKKWKLTQNCGRFHESVVSTCRFAHRLFKVLFQQLIDNETLFCILCTKFLKWSHNKEVRLLVLPLFSLHSSFNKFHFRNDSTYLDIWWPIYNMHWMSDESNFDLCLSEIDSTLTEPKNTLIEYICMFTYMFSI
jgi:hypothetical protein